MNSNYRTLALVLAAVVFWSWNLMFVSMLFTGYGPILLYEMLWAAVAGVVPWSIAGPALLFLGLPFSFMLLGLMRLRADPGRLLSLFYGVQAPLMLLCLVRIFGVGPLSAPTVMGGTLFVISALGLLRTVLHGFEERAGWAQVLRQVAGSVTLLVSGWTALVMAIYAGGLVGQAVLNVDDLVVNLLSLGLREVFFVIPFLGSCALVLGVLAIYPIAMVGVGLRSWQVVHRATSARWGAPMAVGLTAATLVLALGGQRWASHSDHRTIMALAERAVAPEATDADRRAAMDEWERVKTGLVAVRTAPDRLFDADPEGRHIRSLYEDLLPWDFAQVPQGLWAMAMAPFSYQPVTMGSDDRWGGNDPTRADVRRAAELYAALFDASMARTERETLLASAKATWSWQDAQAGLLDIGGRRVFLDRQELTVDAHGDSATVLVHDVYRSHDWDAQEVFVAFHLPESAAVTGLWLGANDDRSQAFTHVLASRGAAQEVYEQQVERGVDPALLEQVGPRQYRLRAFPILPRERDRNDVKALFESGPEFHVWIEVQVPRVGDRYPLPVATEVRNLFWDETSRRDGPVDRWLPDSVPAQGGPLQPQTSIISGWQITATPGEPQPATPGRTAVWIDATASMGDHRQEIAAALEELRVAGPMEVWCTIEAKAQPCPSFDPHTALFFGSMPLEVGLQSWTPDVERRVVLTDAGSYELALPTTVDLPFDRPLWLVHLGKEFPDAYPDAVLDAMQRSGGGAVGGVAELSARSDVQWLDGWRWDVARTDVTAPPKPFDAIAARILIAHLERESRSYDIAFLDGLQALAREADVVTSYSSMLVLVNAAQLQALAEAEAQDDRFQREVQGDDLPPLSTIPEPTTWLLLGVGALAVGATRRARRAV